MTAEASSFLAWTIFDGTEVKPGDHVAIDLYPDEVGVIVGVADGGLPLVSFTEGPRRGKERAVSPLDMPLRVRAAP